MNQLLFKIRIFFLSLFILSVIKVSAQSNKFSFSLSSGIFYLPLKELEQYYNKSTIEGIRFNVEKNINFMPFFALGYTPVVNHKISVGIEYFQLQPLMRVIFDKPIQTYMEIPNVKYNIQGIPISFIYEYQLSEHILSPFASIGMSYFYVKINEEKLYTARNHIKNQYSGNIYSANISVGMKSELNDNWQISSLMIYKYSSTIEYKDSYHIKLSGFYFYLGVSFCP